MEQIEKIIPTLVSTACVPVCVNPNAGLPVTVGGKTIYDVKPREFGEYAARFVKAGAAVVGGCCGTEPEHIKCVSQAVRGTKPQLPRGRRRTAVSSYAKTVELSGAPKIIGERINPTGKPMMKKALLDGDYEYILREGIKQTECGADILDVNVGLPGIDEASAMERAVTGLQGVTDAPLQIDTSDIAAMERALRLYNGRPLINSVNGKKESLDAVLPLVKKYGAVAVALTLDENGIPDSAAGRIKIAEKILKRAESLEIDKSSLVFDALAMTVSTGKDNAEIALETLLYIKNTLGCSTVLGVSNISFGLPHREFINSAFFTMAMHSGLSAGIINPLSGDMMRAYRSYCALAGFDPGCAEYIKEYSSLEYSQPSVPEPNREKVKPAEDKSDMDGLYGAVVKGLKELAGATARMLLKEKQPLDIINGQLIPALDEVGRGFENKTVFLPQLLMSADAAKAAFEEIKRDMESRGVVSEKKGKIILATVKGDIHDIGKNIVKVLLENYGFDVIDLGKDVEPQAVADRAVKENVRLVGLSALMTTTVASMEETVKLLRRSCGCKIMVGGAVLNEEYAKSIGADFYSKDAMGSVRYADELFSLK